MITRMSRKYKFYNPEGIYFVSFATVFWIDVFIREIYFEKVTEALEYCRKNRGMKIYGYCIMPSHIHLLFKAEQSDPAELIRDLKHFTATSLIRLIKNNQQESRKEWLLWMFERAGKRSSKVTKYQFWQHHDQPIEIHSDKFFDEKLDYIHQNPVVSGFVSELQDWKYSSEKNYWQAIDPVLDIDVLS